MQARIIVVVTAIAVISLALGISIESAISPVKTTTLSQTVTETRTGNQNESAVISSNSHYTTQYIFCAGIPVCGITSATLFTDSTTTVIVFVYPDNYTLTLSHQISSSTPNSQVCTFPGQSMGLGMSILSDSSSTPVIGANVAALYEFNGSCSGGFQQRQTTQSFTSNNTQWNYLYGLNNGNYTFSVAYSVHTYNFTAQLRPSVYTCAILSLPSGKTNITFTQTSC